MKAYISTYPALGQVTEIDKRTAILMALLEVDESRKSEKWQVSLFHSTGKEWYETPMDPLLDTSIQPTVLQASAIDSGLVRIFFTTPLSICLPTRFTVKFRNNSDQPWKWAKDNQGAADGIIIMKTITNQNAISCDLGSYIEGLNPIFRFKNFRSQSPGTILWSIEAPIEAAEGERSAIKDIKFGLPWGKGKFLRWMALVRLWSPWLSPRHGKTQFELDKEAVMCSFLSLEGKHLVLLAISGVDDVMTLFSSDDDGNVILRVRNDRAASMVSRILVGLSDSFESANCAVMYHARTIVSPPNPLSEEHQRDLEVFKNEEDSTKLWSENWYDGLTFCTWNSLGQRLTEDKIISAVVTLAENNINITNFIIDDNWQAIDYKGHGQFQYGWLEFEAEREAFPKGLKHTVSLIREKQPSIQHVAVWHAILGYWGGIAPDGKLAESYKTVEVIRKDAQRRNLPLGGKITVVDKEDVSKFYDDFYRFLSSCGVDAVKTDAQFMLDTFTSAVARRDLIPAYLDAWMVSSLRHFSVKAISCMSQTPQILFHSQMPQNRPPILVRNSDDFFPEILASHPWHIFCNAHNALFTQHLNLIPDWDMFQTAHDYSGFHAAARCVSGGPIYITDIPGQHNLDLIRQITGINPRGKTIIFRTSVVGKSLDHYNGYNDDNLLLVGTYNGSAKTGTGIIGLFNVSQRPLSELISLSKFPGVEEDSRYIVRAHRSGLVTKPMGACDNHALINVSLGIRGYDVLSAYPLHEFVNKREENISLANLGLLGKMVGAAAIIDNRITLLENGRILIDTNLKALGILGLYISTLPKMSFYDDMIVTIHEKVVPVHSISISDIDEHVLEIDVESAWKELELESGWSNEVEVKIYFNSSL